MARSADGTLKANVFYGAVHVHDDHSFPWVALRRVRHIEPISLPRAKVLCSQHKDAFTYHGPGNVWVRWRACAQVWHSKPSLTASKDRRLRLTFPYRILWNSAILLPVSVLLSVPFFIPYSVYVNLSCIKHCPVAQGFLRLDYVFSELHILCISTRTRLLCFLKTGSLVCFNLPSLICWFSIH